VRLTILVGRHAGETREFPVPVGRQLLADGRAVLPDADAPPPAADEAPGSEIENRAAVVTTRDPRAKRGRR
jgi:hypothetical protein